MDALWAQICGILRGFVWNTLILPEMLLALKSQKMPNHADTWSHQTTTVMWKNIWRIPYRKRDTTNRSKIPQMPSCNQPCGQKCETRLHVSVLSHSTWIKLNCSGGEKSMVSEGMILCSPSCCRCLGACMILKSDGPEMGPNVLLHTKVTCCSVFFFLVECQYKSRSQTLKQGKESTQIFWPPQVAWRFHQLSWPCTCSIGACWCANYGPEWFWNSAGCLKAFVILCSPVYRRCRAVCVILPSGRPEIWNEVLQKPFWGHHWLVEVETEKAKMFSVCMYLGFWSYEPQIHTERLDCPIWIWLQQHFHWWAGCRKSLFFLLNLLLPQPLHRSLEPCSCTRKRKPWSWRG